MFYGTPKELQVALLVHTALSDPKHSKTSISKYVVWLNQTRIPKLIISKLNDRQFWKSDHFNNVWSISAYA